MMKISLCFQWSTQYIHCVSVQESMKGLFGCVRVLVSFGCAVSDDLAEEVLVPVI